MNARGRSGTGEDPARFTAYEIGDVSAMPVEPAPRERDWMRATHAQFAARCLPMLIANEAGWTIASPVAFAARWTGGPGRDDVEISFVDGVADPRILSHFGSGIVTIEIPYLFRSPPGVDLWVKGPSNWVKDAIQPLEGVVETDWTISTFTMNWKLTRPDLSVSFDAGEPICMIVPVPRELAAQLEPERRPLTDDARLADEYRRWSRARQEFAAEQHPSGAHAGGWQQDYMRGRDVAGDRFDGHRTRARLRTFGRPDR